MKTHCTTPFAFLICLVIVVLLPAAAVLRASMISGILMNLDETLPQPGPGQIEFEIGFDSKLKSKEKTKSHYIATIYCSWRNISDKPVPLLLKDHDHYHGTLDYPFGINIKILNDEGVVLTATYPDNGGWWASSRYSAQSSSLMPGDIIILEPGEQVIRKISIDDVLGHLTHKQAADKAPRRPDGVIDMTKTKIRPFKIPLGKNRIEIKYWDLVAINSLILNVVETSNKVDVASLVKKDNRSTPNNPWDGLKNDLNAKQEELDALVAKLEQIYSKDKAFLEALENSQEKWKAYCDALYEMRFPDKYSTRTGGSDGGTNRYRFLIEMYNARIADLQKWTHAGDDE